MDDLSFYADPYLAEITARVARAEAPTGAQLAALRLAAGAVPPDVSALRLDRTIFYPEGGGQPGDRGSVVFEGRSIPVLTTVKLRNNIRGRRGGRAGEDPDFDGSQPPAPVHLAACAPGTLKEGDEVRLVLDWEHRYLYMRLHTAQHLLSGLLHSRFGIGTVSVHLGEGGISIETDREAVAEEEASALEDLANEKILEGLTVSFVKMSQENAQNLGLRRSIKVDGEVRIVQIDTVDQVACGGLHVRRTSECGLVAYQGQERIRGHARLFFKAGPAAAMQRKEDRRIVGRLCALRSEQPHLLLENIAALQEACEREKAANGKLALRLAEAVLKEKASPEGIAAFTLDQETMGLCGLNSFIGASDSFDDLALAVFGREEERLLWLVALKGRYGKIPFPDLKRRLLDRLGAKGGGRSPFFRGMAEPASEEELSRIAAGFVKIAGEAYGR